MRPPHGMLLLVLLLQVYFGFIFGRSISLHIDRPAIFVEKQSKIRLLLGDGFSNGGLHQFSDDIDLFPVIKLTRFPIEQDLLLSVVGDLRAIDGEMLESIEIDNEIVDIECVFMPATQRIALGVPLHPDKMSLKDWEALPGVGPRLARRIEEDRQKNGDFGSLNALIRVPGIGKKSIKRWKSFFGQD